MEHNNSRQLRIFVGIKVDRGIAQSLFARTIPLRGIPETTLIPSDDVHITLLPPWNTADIAPITETIRDIAHKTECFSVNFNHIRYGPTVMKPWLLWAECGAGAPIIGLKKVLLHAFGHHDEMPFRPHATLARVRKNGQMIMKKYPIDGVCHFTQYVNSIELFESPQGGGTGYRIRGSLPLRRGAAYPN
jgi:2'-5' RNA ligase